jgi:hypothetical protein
MKTQKDMVARLVKLGATVRKGRMGGVVIGFAGNSWTAVYVDELAEALAQVETMAAVPATGVFGDAQIRLAPVRRGANWGNGAESSYR